MVSPLQASPLQIWTSLGPLRVLLSQAWPPTHPTQSGSPGVCSWHPGTLPYLHSHSPFNGQAGRSQATALSRSQFP